MILPLRSSLQSVFSIRWFIFTIPPPVAKTHLHPSITIDFDGSLRGGKKPISVSDKDISSQFKEPPQEGISAHKIKDYKTAWTCFQARVDLDNSKAKYWKGYYLWEGYCGYKDKTLATKLFKEAADEGVADAQLRYAFSFFEDKTRYNQEEFIQYLKMAADNSNSNAQFNLGDIYINEKLGVEKDIVEGTKYLKLAALNKHPKATEILKRMEINIYNY
ncbi:13272_t:CDS:2 [Entrophospora sp. SA101]|nr:13272_t:CDS:2 [Entrophospora sp. SA101]